MIDDFTKASEDLPTTRTVAEAGHATKGAALAFLGRAYLYRGDWANAQATLKSIVDNASVYHYKLQDNYSELFDGQHEDAVENGGGEGIFAIGWGNYGSDVWNTSTGNSRLWSSWMDQLWSPGEVNGWDAGVWGYHTMLEAFLQEPTATGAIDPRAEATLAWDHDPTPAYDATLYSLYQSKGYAFDPNYIYYQKNYHDTWATAGWTVNGTFIPKLYIKKYQYWWNDHTDQAASFLDTYCMRLCRSSVVAGRSLYHAGECNRCCPAG